MIVWVRLFARARELAGGDRVAVELGAGATVADLRRRLGADYPSLAQIVERSAVAVNGEFANDALGLPAGAEVALVPPVSGG